MNIIHRPVFYLKYDIPGIVSIYGHKIQSPEYCVLESKLGRWIMSRIMIVMFCAPFYVKEVK
jgi:hypothetical protein